MLAHLAAIGTSYHALRASPGHHPPHFLSKQQKLCPQKLDKKSLILCCVMLKGMVKYFQWGVGVLLHRWIVTKITIFGFEFKEGISYESVLWLQHMQKCG